MSELPVPNCVSSTNTCSLESKNLPHVSTLFWWSMCISYILFSCFLKSPHRLPIFVNGNGELPGSQQSGPECCVFQKLFWVNEEIFYTLALSPHRLATAPHSVNASYSQVELFRSIDDGQTWTSEGSYCFSSPLSHSLFGDKVGSHLNL